MLVQFSIVLISTKCHNDTVQSIRPIAAYSLLISSPWVFINLFCVFVLIPYHPLLLPSAADPGSGPHKRIFVFLTEKTVSKLSEN